MSWGQAASGITFHDFLTFFDWDDFKKGWWTFKEGVSDFKEKWRSKLRNLKMFIKHKKIATSNHRVQLLKRTLFSDVFLTLILMLFKKTSRRRDSSVEGRKALPGVTLRFDHLTARRTNERKRVPRWTGTYTDQDAKNAVEWSKFSLKWWFKEYRRLFHHTLNEIECHRHYKLRMLWGNGV